MMNQNHDIMNKDNDKNAEESTLRSALKEKPKNAKLMSRLSYCLIEQSKQHKGNVVDEQEAMCLAKTAMQIAPHKPYGYIAMSMIANVSHKERMNALQQAITILKTKPQFDTIQWKLTRLTLLIRSLTEPSDIKQVQQQRRLLSNQEESIYENEVLLLLIELWKHDMDAETSSSTLSLSISQLTVLCNHEYQLGKYFRKKLPAIKQQERSVQHFQTCVRGYTNVFKQQLYEEEQKNEQNDDDRVNNTMYEIAKRHLQMAHFWLATMKESKSNHDDTTATATSSSSSRITKCPSDYIVRLYSTFSKRFDDTLLRKLQYETPTKLRKLLDNVLEEDEKGKYKKVVGTKKRLFYNVIDLGCGTGLSGIAFHDLSDGHFTGIDLSKEMIEQAKQRIGCYTELLVGDIMNAFDNEHDDYGMNDNPTITNAVKAYDLIIACDVFCYIGDLSDIFHLVSKSFSVKISAKSASDEPQPVLHQPRYFCFSTEALLMSNTELQIIKDYELRECARFVHSEQYIKRLAKQYGMHVVRSESAVLRKNQAKEVIGHLVVMTM